HPLYRARTRAQPVTEQIETGAARLIANEGGGPTPRKSAVVPTKPILTAANMPIIGGHHVLALQSPPEGWQATSLLERCREHTRRRRARGAAARSLSG